MINWTKFFSIMWLRKKIVFWAWYMAVFSISFYVWGFHDDLRSCWENEMCGLMVIWEVFSFSVSRFSWEICDSFYIFSGKFLEMNEIFCFYLMKILLHLNCQISTSTFHSFYWKSWLLLENATFFRENLTNFPQNWLCNHAKAKKTKNGRLID